jgi:hypothetical protein
MTDITRKEIAVIVTAAAIVILIGLYVVTGVMSPKPVIGLLLHGELHECAPVDSWLPVGAEGYCTINYLPQHCKIESASDGYGNGHLICKLAII